MLRDPCVQASSARGISWSLFAHVLLHLWLWYATNSHIPVPPLQCHWFISNDSCCLIVRLFLGKMSNILPWYSSPLTHLTVRRWFQLFHGYLLFPLLLVHGLQLFTFSRLFPHEPVPRFIVLIPQEFASLFVLIYSPKRW